MRPRDVIERLVWFLALSAAVGYAVLIWGGERLRSAAPDTSEATDGDIETGSTGPPDGPAPG